MTAGRYGPVLFLVPARGGSRRIPGKNLRTVSGIPLVGWAVRTARLAADPDDVVVCSTDDAAIATAARAWGGAVLARPAELATAQATSVDVAIHALDQLGPERFRVLVLVQPTSPLTEPADLRAAVAAFDAGDGRSVVSVTASHPGSFHLDDSLAPVEGPEATRILTGAFYAIAPEALRRDRAFVAPGRTTAIEVPAERSVDVDEPPDLALAEALAAARSIRAVRIGDRELGGGRAFLIAEAGVNHDGEVSVAHRLIDAAADAGADAVKFQTFSPDALAAPAAPTAAYQRAAGDGADQRGMLARLALPDRAWPELQSHAVERGLVFFSSPFDDASADLLARLGVPAIKVASGELTNLPFLERLAARGIPLLVSTGMADMVEVAAAMDAIRDGGDPPVALFHCVSSYPAAAGDANLRAMATLRSAFRVPVGWSDHTPGTELPVAAATLGAQMIEKHLTLDRTGRGPDHAASIEPREFAAMVAAVRSAEAALGTGDKRPTPAEAEIAAVARRSLHWARSLPAGAQVGEADLVALRPGTGVAPGRRRALIGARTARSVAAGAAVVETDVEAPT